MKILLLACLCCLAFQAQALINCKENPQGTVYGVKNIATGITEWRFKNDGTVFGVYNPVTELVEWHGQWRGGVFGLYNPDREKVEWRSSWNASVYGVYHPSEHRVEWLDQWDGGVHGVYNEDSEKIEWMQKWRSGVFGVYNPLSKKVEWRIQFHGDVSGVYDPEQEKVQWITMEYGDVFAIYDNSAKLPVLKSLHTGAFEGTTPDQSRENDWYPFYGYSIFCLETGSDDRDYSEDFIELPDALMHGDDEEQSSDISPADPVPTLPPLGLCGLAMASSDEPVEFCCFPLLLVAFIGILYRIRCWHPLV